jgi:hypothetical protein
MESEKSKLHVIIDRLRQFSQSRGFDILVLSGFGLFALIFTLGRWSGITPFVFLDIDATYISSYAAALDHPGAFVNDYFLSVPSRVSAYFEILVPLIRFLNTLTGSYGNAFLVLLPLVIFCKLFGFYILGKRLFGNRGLGLLLALVTYPIVYSGAWDYWGIRNDALPRNLFEVFLPWVILAAVSWINKPRRWVLLSALLGLLIYVHSISAGVIFTTLCIVYLLCSRGPINQRLLVILLSIFCFAVVSAPFFYIYYTSQSASVTLPVSYVDSVKILNQIYGENHFQTLTIFAKVLVQLSLSGIVPLTLLAYLYHKIVQKTKPTDNIKVLGVWIASIILVSVFLPALERLVDPWIKLSSIQMMLIRGLRYLPPLMLIFCFEVFFGIQPGQKEKSVLVGNAFGSIAIIAAFVMIISMNPQDHYFLRSVECMASGRLTCPTQKELDGVDIISALDDYTSESDTILSVPPSEVKFNTAIRFEALRCMGYSDSDMTRLNADPGLQIQIANALEPWTALDNNEQSQSLDSYLALSREMKADYLIVSIESFPDIDLFQKNVVYMNSSYALLKVP